MPRVKSADRRGAAMREERMVSGFTYIIIKFNKLKKIISIMPPILEVLKIERDRKTPADYNVVHMYKTGKFYTSYDWSAWIISEISYTDAVRMQTRDRRPLAVTRIKMATGDRTFCKIGIPFTSIDKFCPARYDFDGVANDHITFRIPMPQPADGSEVTFERLENAVEKWTESHEIKPRKRTQEETKQIKAQRKTETAPTQAPIQATAQAPAPTAIPTAHAENKPGGIIQQIISYPLANSTPADNIAFIQQLKQQITNIL